MGSCFSDEIGSRLRTAGFDVLCNPFGTLYNPLSIAQCLERAIQCQPVTVDDLVQHDGLWHSWLHHSRFSNTDRDRCLDMCNQSIEETHAFLSKRPVLMITFGTAWVFELRAEYGGRRVVANCHKIPANHFIRRRITVQEVMDTWKPAISQIAPITSHMLFTVSPIRHMADGAHGNQLSKSTLLLAIDELQNSTDKAHPLTYFDSYEILNDELRDYRYYTRDLCHPSDVAVDIVWERFQQTYMSDSTRQRCQQHESEARRSAHRPIV